MYLNKIDDLIDRVIDDFYTVVILKNKDFKQLLSEENFIKFQGQLNDMIQAYINGIPEDTVNEITKKQDSIDDLFDTLTRYCIIHAFLTIGANYTGKPDVFINNIIEFSKNQAQYSLRVNNFFNSESNAEVIKFYYMTGNILKVLQKQDIQESTIRKEPYAADTIKFLKELGTEFIDAIFRNPDNTDADNIHNIIKTLMILLIYRINDKKRLYNVIQQSERTEGEYVFIDIIEPITEHINFMTVESLLSKEDAMAGLAHEMWNFMQEVHEEDSTPPMSNEDKIDILINSGIVVPILDDFLLYHRDSERYDRAVGAQVKKKEDTKIRYIIGKIDTTTEFYSDSAKKDSKLKATIMKNFSNPLYNRKAILRNDVEEIKIINKFLNQGKRNQENNDYFNDLQYYRRYAYVNFKDFDKYGFNHPFSKTVTAVRAVNFDKKSEFRQINDNHRMQRRVGSKGMTGNIVGFMIPPTTKSIQCLKVGDGVDVRELNSKNKSKNGYELFLRQLINVVIKGRDTSKAIYWVFDLNTDSVKSSTFQKSTSTTDQDTLRSMIAEIHNAMMIQVYHEVIEKIDMVPDITPHVANKIIRYMERNVLGVPLTKDLRYSVMSHLYKKYPIDEDGTHIVETDDILHGIEGDVFKLPEYVHQKKVAKNVVAIDLAEVELTGEAIETETIDAVCQHNITWDSINHIRFMDQSEYMKNMYEFIQQYVIEDTTGDFVCRSCGYYLDIARFIIDGKFDDSSQKFITFSMPMEVDIVELPEYRKLDFAIKLMDKNIDKICSSVGIPYFVGNNTTVKWRRQGIVKSAIDLVKANNHLLTKTLRTRNEKKEAMYGISRNLSSLFVFEMENNIYTTSSKDKDQEQFKMIKRNNITTYIMIYLILELNESQITFFNGDKKGLCDIRIFDKVGDSLFRGLRIKKNSSNETVPITDYKLLCYVIYMLSCRVAKHRMWYSSHSVQKNVNKMIPIIQRFIVHTLVDVLNSILENSFKENVPYIFEIFRVRFYSKLNDLFSDDDYYQILLDQSKETYAIAKRRGKIDPSDIKNIRPFTFMDPVWRNVIPRRHFLRYRDLKEIDLKGVTNLSHCPSGDYHVWKIANAKGSNFICDVCGTNMAEQKYDEALTKKISEKFLIKRMNRLAIKFCLLDGQPHNYQYDPKTGKNICAKCKNSDTHEYSNADLDKVDKILNYQKKESRELQIAKNRVYDEVDIKHSTYIDSVVERNAKEFEKSKTSENPFKFIDTFIDSLQSILGEEVKGAFPIHLSDNTYIIDHDYYGHKLDGDDIVIRESDKKVSVKINHSHYKTDVIYYTDYSAGRVDVFYDAVSRRLLGYKEESKEYYDHKKSDKKIRINYSTANKLKLMGYEAQYINIFDSYPELSTANKGKSIEDRQPMYRQIVSDMCRERLEHLKKVMLDFQRITNRIINRYVPEKMIIMFGEQSDKSKTTYTKKSGSSIIPYAAVTTNPYAPENPTYFADKLDDLIDRYSNKLAKLKVTSTDKKHKAFKHWKAIARGIIASEKVDLYLNSESDILDSYLVNRYDNESHQIMYYTVMEFTKLLEYNNSSFLRSSLATFLVEFIDRIFFEFNEEHIMTNADIRRFMYIAKSPRYVREVMEEAESGIVKEGFYDEVAEDDIEITEEQIEENIDAQEEMDAIDIDVEFSDMEEGFASAFDYASEMAAEQVGYSAF
jgi:hypothetical protein